MATGFCPVLWCFPVQQQIKDFSSFWACLHWLCHVIFVRIKWRWFFYLVVDPGGFERGLVDIVLLDSLPSSQCPVDRDRLCPVASATCFGGKFWISLFTYTGVFDKGWNLFCQSCGFMSGCYVEQSMLLRLSLKLNSLKGFCSFLSGNMKYIEMYTHWQHSLPNFFLSLTSLWIQGDICSYFSGLTFVTMIQFLKSRL